MEFVKQKIIRFISQAEPVPESWIEQREVFELGNHLYIVKDNYPHWTISDIREFCRMSRIKPFDIDVVVTPLLDALQLPRQREH